MTPDFSLVYSQLDLPPDCSLEEFRSAYMRRIAELHPDRRGSEPASAEAQATLRELVSTYVAVTRFHRRYGRMPGASPRSSGNHAFNPMMTAMRPALQIPVASSNETTEKPSKATARLVVIIVVLGLLLAFWEITRLLATR
ncbi:J domain-containing protein [Lysobacter korlensis]|uniref:J domain-containing protein n=1 Tax=Lysobacter korlensis TaxID=553636 RepID=A0ABV6RQ62_9GAMM